MTTALATRQTVVELVRSYEECEQDIRSGFARIDGALSRLGLAFGDAPQIRGGRREAPLNFSDPEPAVISLRRHCWQQLVVKLELAKICSVKRWQELWKQVSDGPDSEVPEITVDLVMGMAQGFHSQLEDMLRESVKEVYDWLRPRCSDYKTNSEFGVGKRVILSGVIEGWALPRWTVDWRYSQELRAVERVFRMLDGRSTTGTEGQYYSEIETAIRATPPGETCRGETNYFGFKAYRNRNLHLEILREDLLAHLNRVAGGGMLPTEASRQRKGPTPEGILERAVGEFRSKGRPFELDFYATPHGLAREAVEWLELGNGMALLEPSAGDGVLIRAAISATECAVDAFELDPERESTLHELGASVRCADFLSVTPTPEFDRVLMNPPFSSGRDVLHVAHAFRFLKPGGILVAIMSGGVVFREGKVYRAFRELVAENQGEIRNNPDNSFKSSGTGARTVMVKIRRAK